MSEEVTVKARYLRISPKKAIPLARKFRNVKTDKAYELIQVMENKFSVFLKKLLDSGIAAAKEKDLDEDFLVVKEVLCNQGPSMKRRLIRSRGRADIIKKRSTNLVLTLKEDKSSDKSKNKTKKEKSKSNKKKDNKGKNKNKERK